MILIKHLLKKSSFYPGHPETSHNKASNLTTKLELGVFPIHVKIYQLVIKYFSRMEKLIKSNDNHKVLLRNAYLEDKQLYIENKKCWLSCIKSC